MKAVSLACRVLAAALSVAVLALMFFGIVHVKSSQGVFELSAAQLAFGSDLTDAAGNTVDLAKSAWFFFDLIMAAITAVCAVAAFFKGNTCTGDKSGSSRVSVIELHMSFELSALFFVAII